VCGRICPQDRLCEGACTLNDGLGAVSIGAIEKYITDEALKAGWRPDMSNVQPTGKRVAIVGAGPAGLGCATSWCARRAAGGVRSPRPHRGLLTFGIPPFKLEKEVMEKRHEIMADMGSSFASVARLAPRWPSAACWENTMPCSSAWGLHLCEGRLPGRGAAGSVRGAAVPHFQHPARAGVPGAAHSLISLRGKRVMVLGAGYRHGLQPHRHPPGAQSVTCTYRRDEPNMTGSRRDYRNSREEGVEFLFNRQPIEIVGAEQVEGVKLVQTRLGEPDARGRRVPQAVAGSEQVVPADAVIIAFGFLPSPPHWLNAHEIRVHDNGRVRVSAHAAQPFQTTNPRVFAAETWCAVPTWW